MKSLVGRFSDFQPIPNARVPILKCVHIQTGYPCDLNFVDPLGFFNSRILGFLLHFDPRTALLAMVIKGWMKVHQCIGRFAISNYMVMWLIVFYLQRLLVPILPPLTVFQVNIPPIYVRGFNVAFNNFIPNLTANKSNVMELVCGFFEFYRKYDFQSNIICPLLGISIAKDSLHTRTSPALKKLYDHVKLRKQDIPFSKDLICIQDPIEVTRVCSGNISKDAFTIILRKFEFAAKNLDAQIKNQENLKNVLLQLFDYEKYDNFANGNDKEKCQSGK